MAAGPDTHACGQGQADGAHWQYPSGFESCQRCCGAVAYGRPLEDVLGLCRGENHETFATVAAAKPARGGGVTAEFRINAIIRDATLTQTCVGGPYILSDSTLIDLKKYIPGGSCFNIQASISGGGRIFLSSQAQGYSGYLVKN